MKTLPTLWLYVVASCALLAQGGCGGGGDAAETGAPPAAVASTHPTGSEERAVFDLLNAERARCGFGTLAQNAALDIAARGHADYQSRHNLFTHEQDPVAYPLGFTGERPVDRVLAAGYSSPGAVADEIVRFSGSADKAGLGTRGLRNLLNAPYHLRGLMDGYREVGIAVRSSADAGSSGRLVYLQINPAFQATAGARLLAGSEVATYPCEGTSGVDRQLRNETPSPIPGRDLATQPLGSVVLVAVRAGNTLSIRSASMTEVDTGQSVVLRPPVTASNDPHGGCLEGCFLPHQAYLAADVPLAAFTRYRMEIQGDNDGIAFDRSFIFTTGPGG